MGYMIGHTLVAMTNLVDNFSRPILGIYMENSLVSHLFLVTIVFNYLPYRPCW